MAPLGTALPAIGAFLSAHAAPLSLGLGAASLGASMYQGKRAKDRAEGARQQSLAMWDKYSKPDPSVLEAQAKQNRGQLGQARLGAYKNLASSLAARAFGSGSGLGIEGAGNIESGYLRGLAQSQTDQTKFAGTRQFGMPESAYGVSVPGGIESGLGQMGGILDTALGMFMANKLLGGGGVPTTTPPTAPPTQADPYGLLVKPEGWSF